ncbi:MAG: transporter related [Frankiales bacterium]|nr:transporter related [Frankiales bacterium]
MRPVLTLSGVTVRFGGLTAVDVDQLVIQPARIVGLVGANGAGKTTLLDAISGHTACTGSMQLLGRELAGMSPAQRARLGLGRSYQNAALFDGLTVAETLAVAFDRALRSVSPVSSILHLPAARRRERAVARAVTDLVEQLGLQAYRDKFIGELSTGSRRIVDLAGIFAARPRVVLLDEPSSGIAQREVEQLAGLLRAAQTALGCTMVVVEHDIPLLRSLSDEMFALETGRVIAHGTADEVLADPAVISSYLGTGTRAVERSGSQSSAFVSGTAAGGTR